MTPLEYIEDNMAYIDALSLACSQIGIPFDEITILLLDRSSPGARDLIWPCLGAVDDDPRKNGIGLASPSTHVQVIGTELFVSIAQDEGRSDLAEAVQEPMSDEVLRAGAGAKYGAVRVLSCTDGRWCCGFVVLEREGAQC